MTVSRTICLGFLAVILAGTLLLALPIAISDGQWTWDHLFVSLFTATSAVCVTGHIVVDTGTYFSPFGQGVILLLIQIGGLGYMTATTMLLLLLGRRFGLRDKVALQQALDRPEIEGAAHLIRSITATTLIFEISGVFLLMLVFAPEYGLDRGLWLSVFHSVSAWNNAGFSLFSDSLMGFQASILLNVVVSLLIVVGGMGYDVIFESYLWLREQSTGRAKALILSLHFKVVTSTTLVLLGVGAIAFFFMERGNPNTLNGLDWPTKLMAAWFQSVTCRTAGFNSIDISQMTTAGLFFSIALMFVGGSPGGTAGGIKTTTLRVLSSCTRAILRGQECVILYERQIPMSLVLKAVGVALGSVSTVVVITTLIAFFEPQQDFIRVLFEVVSAYATVGLSTGITASLSLVGKMLLALTMYMGRVGILLLMAALLGDPKPTFVQYPEENMLVG